MADLSCCWTASSTAVTVRRLPCTIFSTFGIVSYSRAIWIDPAWNANIAVSCISKGTHVEKAQMVID